MGVVTRGLMPGGRRHGLKGLIVLCLGHTLLFASLAFGATAIPVDEEAREVVNPHDFGDRRHCGVCHTENPPELSHDPVTTCTKCHEENVGDHPVVRHPIGKRPKEPFPSILPLSSDGRMVCYTCHDPHKKSAQPNLLRVDYFGLCSTCHPGY